MYILNIYTFCLGSLGSIRSFSFFEPVPQGHPSVKKWCEAMGIGIRSSIQHGLRDRKRASLLRGLPRLQGSRDSEALTVDNRGT